MVTKQLNKFSTRYVELSSAHRHNKNNTIVLLDLAHVPEASLRMQLQNASSLPMCLNFSQHAPRVPLVLLHQRM